jgi:hypothetical protein
MKTWGAKIFHFNISWVIRCRASSRSFFNCEQPDFRMLSVGITLRPTHLDANPEERNTDFVAHPRFLSTYLKL